MADINITATELLKQKSFIGLVIDKVNSTLDDEVQFTKWFGFAPTRARDWKSGYTKVSSVRAGSVIDKYSNNPIEEREAFVENYISVISMGDDLQKRMDLIEEINDILDQADSMDEAVKQAVDVVFDDYRKVVLMPYKRMDAVVGQFLTDAQAVIDMTTNPEGVQVPASSLKIPFLKEEVTKANQAKFLSWLKDFLAKNSLEGGRLIMNATTFLNVMSSSDEFKGAYTALLPNAEFLVTGGLITNEMANKVFASLGLPLVEIVDNYVNYGDKRVKMIGDNSIAVVPLGELGKIRYYDASKKITPTADVDIQLLQGKHVVKTKYTEEGIVIGYNAEWIPEFLTIPQIAILKLKEK